MRARLSRRPPRFPYQEHRRDHAQRRCRPAGSRRAVIVASPRKASRMRSRPRSVPGSAAKSRYGDHRAPHMSADQLIREAVDRFPNLRGLSRGVRGFVDLGLGNGRHDPGIARPLPGPGGLRLGSRSAGARRRSLPILGWLCCCRRFPRQLPGLAREGWQTGSCTPPATALARCCARALNIICPLP